MSQVIPLKGFERCPNSRGSTPPRYLIVHLAAFALERCGYVASDAAVLCTFRRNALRVIAVMPAARRCGVRLGMAISEARALCPEIIVEMWSEGEEESDWNSLGNVFYTYTDRIQRGWDTDVVLEVSNSSHLFGGEQALIENVMSRMQEMGHSSCAAIADDPLAGSIWARSNGCGLIPPGKMAQMLAPLPFHAMRPSNDLFQSVRALDIETIGQWARFDAASVAGRYGVEGVRLHRLANGEVISKVGEQHWVNTEVVVRVEMPEPVYSWPLIEWALRGALEQVVARLRVKQSRPSQIRIHLLGGEVEALNVRIRFGRPSRNVAQLLTLCRHRIERMKLTSPVDVCWIEVEEETQDLRGQFDLLDRRQVSEALPEVVARITNALGEDTVFQAMEYPSWRPEHAWRIVPVGKAADLPSRVLKKPDPVEIQRGGVSFPPRPRPTLLLPNPLPVFVDVKESRPSRIKFKGKWWCIDTVKGPERLSTGWWLKDGGICRNYWMISFGGKWSWIFEDDAAKWAIHGWYS